MYTVEVHIEDISLLHHTYTYLNIHVHVYMCPYHVHTMYICTCALSCTYHVHIMYMNMMQLNITCTTWHVHAHVRGMCTCTNTCVWDVYMHNTCVWHVCGMCTCTYFLCKCVYQELISPLYSCRTQCTFPCLPLFQACSACTWNTTEMGRIESGQTKGRHPGGVAKLCSKISSLFWVRSTGEFSLLGLCLLLCVH